MKSPIRALPSALILVAALAVPVVVAGTVGAQDGPIVFDGSPGTGPPPATLGGYEMVSFTETRDQYTEVNDADVPEAAGGGVVTFDEPVFLLYAGDGWDPFRGGYSGPVYCANCGSGTNGNEITLTLPDNTYAFALYATTNNFGTYEITATADDGTTSGPVEGEQGGACDPDCARYQGFYSTSADVTISTITITSGPGDPGLGIGDFAIATELPPDPPVPPTPPTPTPEDPPAVAPARVTPRFTG